MNKETILTEISYKAVRSSGAGGQNVNKVSSKIILSFNIQISQGFSEEEKELLLQKLKTKISQEDILQISCEENRSQLKNKELVTKKFLELLEKSLRKPKSRKTTKIPKSAIENRIKAKKTNAETKNLRRKPNA